MAPNGRRGTNLFNLDMEEVMEVTVMQTNV